MLNKTPNIIVGISRGHVWSIHIFFMQSNYILMCNVLKKDNIVHRHYYVGDNLKGIRDFGITLVSALCSAVLWLFNYLSISQLQQTATLYLGLFSIAGKREWSTTKTSLSTNLFCRILPCLSFLPQTRKSTH